MDMATIQDAFQHMRSADKACSSSNVPPKPRQLDLRPLALHKSSHVMTNPTPNHTSNSISNTSSKSFAKRECNCLLLGPPACPTGTSPTQSYYPHALIRRLSLASRNHLLDLDLDLTDYTSKDFHGNSLRRQHAEENGEVEGAGLLNIMDENDENSCGPRGISHRWNHDSLSFAKHCETKLGSLLSNVPSSTGDEDLPDVQRTRACFQVLEELCENKLPFSSFLYHICGELKRCLYQSVDKGRESSFSKQKGETYFELAKELQQDILRMETSNSSWKSRLLDEEKDLQRIREELKELRGEIIETDMASDELEENILTAVRALSLEEKKVNGLHQKIKNLKQELKDIKHEVKQTQQIDTMKDEEIREYKKLKAIYMQCVHEFQHVQGFVRACQSDIANSVPKAEVIAAKAEVLELNDKIYEVKAGVDAFKVATRQLTPRPKWGGEMPGMDKPFGVSTAQQVERICKENAFLAANISRFQLGFAASEATLAEIKEQAANKGKSSKKEKTQGNATAKKNKEKSDENASGKSSKTRAKSQEKKKKKKKA